MEDAHDDHTLVPKEQRAALLKERIYLIFTTLAVVLALRSHGLESEARQAAVTLIVTVIGTLLAVFVADVISHLSVHARVPSAQELKSMAWVSFGAIGAVIVPLVFMLGSALAGWKLQVALRVSTVVLIVSLVVVARMAIRNLKLARWQRLLILGSEVVLGLLVIGLELLAHA